MKKNIKIFSIAIMICSIGFLVIAPHVAESSTYETMSSEEFNSKYTDYKNEKEVKDKISFSIKEPKYKYKNMSKVSVEGQKQESALGSLDYTTTVYKTEDGINIGILQAPETGRPSQTLETSKKITREGTDYWVYGNVEDNVQIMVWKNGMYYNVSARNVPVEELLNIAESLL